MYQQKHSFSTLYTQCRTFNTNMNKKQFYFYIIAGLFNPKRIFQIIFLKFALRLFIITNQTAKLKTLQNNFKKL